MRTRLAPNDADHTDDDKPHEECGVFGVFGAQDDSAARLATLGLHALQHRGQEAAGVLSYDETSGKFSVVRRFGLVRDNFTSAEILERLPGRSALGHTRYSTAGSKARTESRDIQPIYGELVVGGVAVAHNGTLTNANQIRAELVGRGSIFQSGSDTECVIHLMARSIQRAAPERLKDALRRVEGAFSIVALSAETMIGVRDPHGVRPLVLGRLGEAWVMTSETVALDIIGAAYVRDVEPGEMVIVDANGLRSERPFEPAPSRFCIFEYVYFSRPDSAYGGVGMYEARRNIGAELAEEAAVAADMVCPVPDSGTPAALGFARASGIPYEIGIVKSQHVGRTFIEPTEEIRNLGVRLKLNVNRQLVKGQRVVLVDDSVVRGTTSKKIVEMVREAGAREIHFRVASPPTKWPCFYGVDTPRRGELIAATHDEEALARALGVDSLRYISLDGLYRACGVPEGRVRETRRFCDACFSGQYPIDVADERDEGRFDDSHLG